MEELIFNLSDTHFFFNDLEVSHLLPVSIVDRLRGARWRELAAFSERRQMA